MTRHLAMQHSSRPHTGINPLPGSQLRIPDHIIKVSSTMEIDLFIFTGCRNEGRDTTSGGHVEPDLRIHMEALKVAFLSATFLS